MKSLFLLDRLDAETEKLISSIDEKLVFPLNIKVYKKLKKSGYEISLLDELLTPSDYQVIDETAIKIGEEWYADNFLKENLTYKKVQLGPLLQHELISTLLKIIHRIVLVDRIITQLKPELIFINSSDSIIDKVPEFLADHHNCEIKKISQSDYKKTFRFDTYGIKFDILNKNLEYKVSRTTFQNLKKPYELFWDMIFAITKVRNKPQSINNPKILLLEFNLVTYRDIIETLSEKNFDLLLLNNRRPAIWNTESLKIAQKINFKKIKFHSMNYDNENEVVKKISEIINSEIIAEKFVVNSINFWSLIKDEFKRFCQERFVEIIELIDNVYEIFENEQVDLVMSWDDSQQIERTIISIANQKTIPTLQIQHGMINLIKDGKRRWHQFPLRNIIVDKYALYGKLAYETCLANGAKKENLVVTGSTRHDGLFKEKKVNKETNAILVTTSGMPSTAYSYFYSTSLIIHYEELMESVFKALGTIQNKEIILKRHPTQDEVLPITQIAKKHLPNVKILSNANTYRLIAESDIVISPPSTVTLEAMILQKPLVLIKYYADDYGIPYIEHGAVMPILSAEDAESAIKKALFDQEIRKKLKEGQKKFIEDSLSYCGTSCEKVAKLIDEMIKTRY